MKRRTQLVLFVSVAIFLSFFFIAPVVSMDLVLCYPGGLPRGYASPSYYLFNVGIIYSPPSFGHDAEFEWWTLSPLAGC
jgi:hypothetical protein